MFSGMPEKSNCYEFSRNIRYLVKKQVNCHWLWLDLCQKEQSVGIQLVGWDIWWGFFQLGNINLGEDTLAIINLVIANHYVCNFVNFSLVFS